MDADIQFGDLEHEEPEVHLRPDENKHFAVTEYGKCDEADLPIFVDMDVMRDMEAHADSDTSVELGGVMLGGQYEDEHGREFVVVTDSLRAEHYESTKGSFKFTHETWEKITRERDEFPEDLQMVGWYHTHPDWGVFLSGMDMFICDHFFNKPLDVALVIDPCRDDRGWFQWTGDPSNRVRRTGGYYLIASRFRRDELEFYAEQLEGKITMANDPRFRGVPGQQQYPAPVVHIQEPRSPWQSVAVLGMLTMQFLFLALIAWKILDSSNSPPTPQVVIDRSDATDSQLASQRELFFEIIGKLDDAPDGTVEMLAKEREENDTLEQTKLGLAARVDQLKEEAAGVAEEKGELVASVTRWESRHEDLKKKNELQLEEIALLRDKLRKLEPATGDDKVQTDGSIEAPENRWIWIASGTVLLVVVIAGAATWISMQKEQEEIDDADEETAPDDEHDDQMNS